MSTHLKPLFLVRLVGIVALIFAAQANFVSLTSAGSFDVGDLKGEYAGLVTGKFGESDSAGLVKIVADGEGQLMLEGRRNIGGIARCTPVRRCDYEIKASGFGTITCDPVPPFGPVDPPACQGSANPAILDILLSDKGRQFDLFLEGPAVVSGHFIRQ